MTHFKGLCIGGERDGKFASQSGPRMRDPLLYRSSLYQSYSATQALRPPDEPVHIDYDEYRYEHIRTPEGKMFGFWILDRLSIADAMSLLISRYAWANVESESEAEKAA